MAQEFNLLGSVKDFETDVFFTTFGKDTRLEISNRSFNIGKVLFALQKLDGNNKQKASAKFYLDIDKALLLANEILSGRVVKIAEYKSKDNPGSIVEIQKYPGGVSAGRAKRPDGKPMYRELTLQKGKIWMLKITEGPGATTETGGFVPDGKPETFISIGLSNETLKTIALLINQESTAYRTAQWIKFLNKTNPTVAEVNKKEIDIPQEDYFD